jgi:hypothetical protein
MQELERSGAGSEAQADNSRCRLQNQENIKRDYSDRRQDQRGLAIRRIRVE